MKEKTGVEIMLEMQELRDIEVQLRGQSDSSKLIYISITLLQVMRLLGGVLQQLEKQAR